MTPQVAILCSDTLQAQGLAAMLSNYFGIEATIVAPESNEVGDCGLYLVDAGTYASRPAFFLPRRGRTVIITDTPAAAPDCICSRQPLEDWLELLQRRIDGLSNVAAAAPSELSQRERDVLALVASGLSNKAIADRLCISVNTVLTHRKNIVAKLGIRSISGLSLYALMHGYTIEH